MKEPETTRLRPEALPPVRSALPILLALATALLAGAIGGFFLHTALPGEAASPPPAAPALHRVPVPDCGRENGGGLFHRAPTPPEKPL